MVVTAIQAILISFVVGIVVGCFIGWKFTFNMRLAKVQEQQVTINKLKDHNDKLRSKIRDYHYQKTKEKAGNAVDAVGKAASATTGAVGNAAASLKERLFKKAKTKGAITDGKE